MTDKDKKAVIYVRISMDRAGEREGVTRQREDCGVLVERRGWHLVDVLEDNDISAAGGKKRPGFEQLISMLENGETKIIVAWNLDRLTRNRADTVRLIETAQAAGAMISLVRGSDMDMGTPAGRMTADILASVARNEIEVKRDRQVAAAAQAARKGKRNGRRHFGYLLIREDGRVTREVISEPEAAVIRWMVDRVLLGASLRSIATDLNEKIRNEEPDATPPSQGKLWNVIGVRRVLTSAHIAGLRSYLGDVVAVGTQWEPIIDRATHDQLVRLLNAPERQTNGAKYGRRLLLSGFAECGQCNGPLYSRPRPLVLKGDNIQAKDEHGELLWHTRAGEQVPTWETQDTYACVSADVYGQVSKDQRHFMRIRADWLDDHVARQVMARLTDPKSSVLAGLAEANQQQATVEAAQQATDDAERSLRELADDYYVGKLMTRQTFLQTQANLQAMVRDEQAKIANATGNKFISQLPTTPEGLQRAYEDNDVVWRRALITAVVAQIVVQPSMRRGSNKFDPERIEITYRY